jgi:hypothetical protein
MSNYTHETAPTQFFEANGVRYAYRRFVTRRKIFQLLLAFWFSKFAYVSDG